MKLVRYFILAAGKGSRLLPLTLSTPKPILPLGNTCCSTSLDHILDKLVGNVRAPDICINLHHLPLQIMNHGKEHDGDHVQFGLADHHIHWAPEPRLMGTAGALKAQEAWVYEAEYVVVINGDTLSPVDYQKLVRSHRRSGAIATVFTHDDAIHSGGVYVFNTDVLEYIPSDTFYSINEDLIPKLIEEGEEIHLCKWKDVPYYDIGTYPGLIEAREYYRNEYERTYH